MKIYTKKQFEAQQNAMKTVVNDAGFVTACEYFRQICSEIGELIGDSEFKGGYDDMPIFYANASYKTDKGVQLAIAWAGVNDLCKYEASKLGIGSPDWWSMCWGDKSNSSSNGDNYPEPHHYNYEIIMKKTNEHFDFAYDDEINIWVTYPSGYIIAYEDGQWLYNISSDGVDYVGITGCTDEYAKDIFPKTDYDDFTVIKIPVYN